MADCDMTTKTEGITVTPPTTKTDKRFIGDYQFAHHLYQTSQAENMELKKNAAAMSLRLAELQAEIEKLRQQRPTQSRAGEGNKYLRKYEECMRKRVTEIVLERRSLKEKAKRMGQTSSEATQLEQEKNYAEKKSLEEIKSNMGKDAWKLKQEKANLRMEEAAFSEKKGTEAGEITLMDKKEFQEEKKALLEGFLFKALKEERQTLEARTEEIEKQKKEIDQAKEKLEAEKQELLQEKSKLEAEKQQLEAARQLFGQQTRDLYEEKIKLLQEKDEMEETKNEVKRAIEKLREEKKKLEEDRKEMGINEQEMKRLEVKLKDVENEKRMVEYAKKNAEQEVMDIKKVLDEERNTLEAEKKQLEQNKVKVDEESKKLEVERRTLEARVGRLEKEQKDLEEDKKMLQTEKTGLEKEKEEFTKERLKMDSEKRKIMEEQCSESKRLDEIKRQIQEDSEKLDMERKNQAVQEASGKKNKIWKKLKKPADKQTAVKEELKEKS
ncbi:trichohyalin-like isoform X2 [Fundulus heteroclitus]|uniref:trichohyalin-like isoform X2 n=1 Tax=Fundulus heteroclitus TaxID=8078 RepID=UPI00165BD517|nr:trichohyalin-like isoform X2 [Fundulus heteroclitus]